MLNYFQRVELERRKENIINRMTTCPPLVEQELSSAYDAIESQLEYDKKLRAIIAEANKK